MKLNVETLVKVAILSALSIILTRFLSIYITPQARIGFGSIPLILSGMFFGPVAAIFAGITSDFIGVLINAGGTPHLGFTFTSVLNALLPAIICFVIYRPDYREKTNTKIILSVISVYFIAHLLLNTLWLSQLFGTPYLVLFSARLLKIIIEAILSIILLKILISRFGKYIA